MEAIYFSINKKCFQAIRRLRKHPNVIQLAEIIYDKGSRTLYLVCELMDMNIYELIKDRTHYLNDHKVKHYMYQLLQVMIEQIILDYESEVSFCK